jgi:hypothetical protein
MATRSLIAIEKEFGVYDASYCHFDGYPDHNGKILIQNYTTEDKVNELLSKGEMSCLRESINKCEFYTQRGEELHVTQNVSYEYLRKKAQDMGCEYIYVFFPAEDVWQYSQTEDNFCSMINL